jgi:hypothetical protein
MFRAALTIRVWRERSMTPSKGLRTLSRLGRAGPIENTRELVMARLSCLVAYRVFEDSACVLI